MTRTTPMYLVHDEVEMFRGRTRTTPLRLRVWRRRGMPPLVLVEPLSRAPVAPLCCRVMGLVYNGLLKGQEAELRYVEHDDGEEGRFFCVTMETFTAGRPFFVHPRRVEVARRDVEDTVGGPV